MFVRYLFQHVYMYYVAQALYTELPLWMNKLVLYCVLYIIITPLFIFVLLENMHVHIMKNMPAYMLERKKSYPFQLSQRESPHKF